MSNNKDSILKKAGKLFESVLYEESANFVSNKSEDSETSESNIFIPSDTTENPNQMNSEMVQTILNSANVTDIDLEYEKQIRKSIRKSDQPGPDFLEFSDAVNGLRKSAPDMPLDSAIRNAYIVLQSGGLTKNRILETGEIYLDVLKNEKSKFENAILKGLESNVQVPQKEIQNMISHSEDLKKQLEELQKTIEINNNVIQKKKDEIIQAQTKLELNKRKFNNTATYVEKEITDLISHVKNLNL